MNDHSEQMYGGENSADSVSTVASKQSSSADDRADQMYGGKSVTEKSETENNTQIEATEREKQLYSEGAVSRENSYLLDGDSTEEALYGNTIEVDLNGLDVSAVTLGGDQSVVLQNMQWIAGLSGANRSEVEAVTSVCNEFAVAPVTDQKEREVAVAETMKTLVTEYGAEQLQLKLQSATQLVNSFENFAEWLDQTGAGNDPRIIRQVLKIVDRPQAKHRLTQLMKRGK
jgi:hypothetical protein